MMQQYHQLLKEILDNGVRQPNRTGIDTLMLPGAMMKFDLRQGFPAITTKRLAFDAVRGELLGFIRGYSDAARFRELGCKIWDANANQNQAWLDSEYRKAHDDLGRIYGVQWRRWKGSDGKEHDQLANAVKDLIFNPTSRRIIVNAWRPDEFDQMALPPCHVLYQFIADTKTGTLHLCMYQRSCDMFLGVPFNIASASLLLSIMAQLTGFEPGVFTHFLADAHIYVNHIEQVKEQLSREHYSPPQLQMHFLPIAFDPYVFNGYQHNLSLKRVVHDTIRYRLDTMDPHSIALQDYHHHPAIKAEMAV